MFNVGRYDPKKETSAIKEEDDDSHKKSTGKKRKRQRTTSNSGETGKETARDDEKTPQHSEKPSTQDSAMYVIAPEAQGPVTNVQRKHHYKIEDEAFDDLEMNASVVEPMVPEVQGDTTTTRSAQQQNLVDPGQEEIRNALRMANLTLNEVPWKLAPFLMDNLQQDGIESFFPIQALVIPDIIASERYSYIRAQDICVSSPTGSGKTLAFVLPILNALAGRKIKRLRALVVLPSRDLAQQVYNVFYRYASGSDLSVGLAIGQSDFVMEQIALTVDSSSEGPPCHRSTSLEAAKQKLLFDTGNAELILDTFSNFDQRGQTIPKGGRSGVDVLVCTPGRLVDHLDNTPGFTLQHLRFLVVDEADRLLSQPYHNWISRVIDSANSASVSAWHELNKNATNSDDSDNINKTPPFRESPDGCSYDIDIITWRRGGAAGDESTFNTNESHVVSTVCRPVQLRKLLYSATLTRDPQKLAALGLVNPKHFDARKLREAEFHSNRNSRGGNKYTMPNKLKEHTVECTAEQKPIVLLALLLERLNESAASKKKSIVAVFTSNLESTHRLARLLQLLWRDAGYGSPDAIAEFSSSLTQKERSHLVKRCGDSNDNISVVVCSDGMSRGMDIDVVGTVINYDVPCFAKTYVHRCGRTARAGREGMAISLLKGGQVGQFSRMRQLIDEPDRITSMGVKKSLVKGVAPVYKSCLKKLADIVSGEENGDLKPTDPLLLYSPKRQQTIAKGSKTF